MKTNFKRVLSLTLALLMVLSLAPMVFATNVTAPVVTGLAREAVEVFNVTDFSEGGDFSLYRAGGGGGLDALNGDTNDLANVALTYNGDKSLKVSTYGSNQKHEQTAVLSMTGGVAGKTPASDAIAYGDEYELNIELAANPFATVNDVKFGAVSICVSDGNHAFMFDITKTGLQLYEQIHRCTGYGQLLWAGSNDNSKRSGIYGQTVGTDFHKYTIKVKDGKAKLYFDGVLARDEEMTMPESLYNTNSLGEKFPYQDVMIIAEQTMGKTASSEAEASVDFTVRSMSLTKYVPVDHERNATEIFNVTEFTQGNDVTAYRVGGSGGLAGANDLGTKGTATYNADGSLTVSNYGSDQTHDATIFLTKEGNISGAPSLATASTVDYGDEYELNIRMAVNPLATVGDYKFGAVSVCISDGNHAFMFDITKTGLQLYQEILRTTEGTDYGRLLWAGRNDSSVKTGRYDQVIDSQPHLYTVKVKDGKAKLYFDGELAREEEMTMPESLYTVDGNGVKSPYQDVMIIAEQSSGKEASVDFTLYSMSLTSYKDTTTVTDMVDGWGINSADISALGIGRTTAWNKTQAEEITRANALRYRMMDNRQLKSLKLYGVGEIDANNTKIDLRDSSGAIKETYNAGNLELKRIYGSGKTIGYVINLSKEKIDTFAATYGYYPSFVAVTSTTDANKVYIVDAAAEYYPDATVVLNMPEVTFNLNNGSVTASANVSNKTAEDKTCNVIVVVYRGDKMVDCKMNKAVTVAKNTVVNVNSGETPATYQAGDIIKAFVWDSGIFTTPLAGVATITAE